MDQQSSNANLTTNLIIDNKKKWKCSQCTYENWPSSIKCTICLASKSLTFKQQQQQTNFKKSKIKMIKLKPNKNSTNKNNNNNESSSLENTNLISSSSSSNENLNDLINNSELVLDSNNKKTNQSITNDIYEIGHQLLTSNNSSNTVNSDTVMHATTSTTDSNAFNSQSIDKQKWPCSVCTYLNWPKSVKCVQCYTPKSVDQKTTTTVDESLAMNDDGDTKINNNNNNKNITCLNEELQQNLFISSKTNSGGCSNNNNNNNNLNRSSCNSPCTVPKQQQQQIGEKYSEISEPFSSTIEQNTSTVMNESTKKWSCSGCTYQNWPKSQRCVMCNLQRNHHTTTNTKSTNSSTKASLNYHQKLKTYQLQMDRLFLAACQGIVDDDMSHLNRYINANGDLTRYLTSDEVKILNRPNVFTVGLTLLHLCYQFKRKEFLMQILSTNSTNKNSKKISTNNNSTTNLSSSTMNLLNALLKQANKTKFSPCQSCPALATNIIERYFSANLRQRKTPNHHHYNRHHDHFYHHISPTSSLISLNSSSQSTQSQQQPVGAQAQTQAQATGLSNNNNILTNTSSNSFNLSPSPSPPPTIGATSLYYQQSQSLCFYVNECYTFILPNEIDDFSPRIQHILFDELLDREVQQELENESRVINWNIDLCKRLDSRLYPLWNRHSGDCLLDSVLQACYGVFDTDNTLRCIMAESLEQYANCFKPRWKEHEILMAQSLDYTLDDYQLEQDWNNVITLANQPGASLEQAHIFALCHIFRRPIIIYSIKYVKSFRGENIGFTHFEGVYLPLIWEPNFCFKSPIALGYTRGHFTALVPLERSEAYDLSSMNESHKDHHHHHHEAGAVSSQLEYIEPSNHQQIFYLPLTNSEGQLLPVHFLTSSELGRERTILRQYLNLDCLVMPGNNCGLYVAKQRVSKRGILVKQMLDEWLSYYRNMQMKQNGTQIEISQENETIITTTNINLTAKNTTNTINNHTNKVKGKNNNKSNLTQEEYLVNEEDDDDLDDEDEDEDEDEDYDDDDDDDDDDDEPEEEDDEIDEDDDDEEEEDEEYCEQINIEEI